MRKMLPRMDHVRECDRCANHAESASHKRLSPWALRGRFSWATFPRGGGEE
jgi:hypothetical protein